MLLRTEAVSLVLSSGLDLQPDPSTLTERLRLTRESGRWNRGVYLSTIVCGYVSLQVPKPRSVHFMTVEGGQKGRRAQRHTTFAHTEGRGGTD